MNTLPSVSVVMPTFRRPDLLTRCLQALLAQDLPAQAYEIVVVDDGPHADTREAVEALAAPGGPAIRYLPNTGSVHGPAAARNLGWQAGRADLVAFTDDDTVPEPDWLSKGLAACGPRVDAAWGHVRMPIPDVPTDYERDAKGLEGAVFVTANCFVKRAALRRVGGFDERFRMAWREDSDLYFSLVSQGLRVVPAPDAVVVHPVRPAPWGVSVQQQKKALFDALLYKKHPRLYRRRIAGEMPRSHYLNAASVAVTAGALLAMAAGVEGAPRTAAVAGTLWLLLSLRFAARRLRGTSHAPRHVTEMLATSAVIPTLSVFWRLVGAFRFRVAFA